MTGRHFILALALAVVLGAGWVFGKAATGYFPPVFVAFLRFGIAGMTIVIFRGWPSVGLRYLLLASTCAISLPYSLSYLGLSRLDVSVTVLLVQLEAPLLMALSAVLLREMPGVVASFGVALAVAGAMVVAGPPSANGHYGAVLIVVASMAIWAGGQIMVRRLGLDAGGPRLLGALSLLAAPQLLLLSLVCEEGHTDLLIEAPTIVWLQVVYLGLVMTVAGVGTWYFLVARYQLHIVAPFLLLVPVCSVAGGVVFLGERLVPSTFSGGALIMIGVALATLRLPRRRRPDGIHES